MKFGWTPLRFHGNHVAMERAYSLRRLDRLFRATSVVALLGPRQCGKTTLARHYSKGRAAYITTFLEQDIPLLGFQIPSRTLRRFWMMLTFYHGQIFNASEIGRSLGVAHTTVQRYLDILNGTFMVRVLLPWVENINKRLVQSPKIYFRDSGLLLSMLGLESLTALQQHPKLGAAWEGFALEEVVRRHGAREEEVFFWATRGEAELDLLVFQGGAAVGV